MRTLALRTLLVLSLAFATMLTTAAPADAAIASSYKGWVKARHHCAGSVICTMEYRYWPAWRWTGSSWNAYQQFCYTIGSQSHCHGGVGEGTWVYAWPFATGWHWVWTQETGWLAMRTSDLSYA